MLSEEKKAILQDITKEATGYGIPLDWLKDYVRESLHEDKPRIGQNLDELKASIKTFVLNHPDEFEPLVSLHREYEEFRPKHISFFKWQPEYRIGGTKVTLSEHLKNALPEIPYQFVLDKSQKVVINHCHTEKNKVTLQITEYRKLWQLVEDREFTEKEVEWRVRKQQKVPIKITRYYSVDAMSGLITSKIDVIGQGYLFRDKDYEEMLTADLELITGVEGKEQFRYKTTLIVPSVVESFIASYDVFVRKSSDEDSRGDKSSYIKVRAQFKSALKDAERKKVPIAQIKNRYPELDLHLSHLSAIGAQQLHDANKVKMWHTSADAFVVYETPSKYDFYHVSVSAEAGIFKTFETLRRSLVENEIQRISRIIQAQSNSG